MDKSVPPGAGLLLDFIAAREAPKGYDTVYANKMVKMPKPLTSMTLAEVIADGPHRTKSFGSSACGRYQFMTSTLQGLRKEMVLMGDDLFTPDFQDRLGYRLLLRRGWARFSEGTMSMTAFGLGLAREWASFPVLVACAGAHRQVTRGETFYAGDKLNKALVRPDLVESALAKAFAAGHAPLTGSKPVTVAEVAIAPDPVRESVQATGQGLRTTLSSLWNGIHSVFKKD